MDEFSRLSRNASLGVHGYALVFSIASRQSFEMIDQINGALLNSLGDLPDVGGAPLSLMMPCLNDG